MAKSGDYLSLRCLTKIFLAIIFKVLTDFFSDVFAKKVLSLARGLNYINSRIPQELYSRLYRYQGFATIAHIWEFQEYFNICCKKESIPNEEFHQILELLKLKCDGLSSIYCTMKSILENIMENQFISSTYKENIRCFLNGINKPCDFKAKIRELIDEEVSTYPTSYENLDRDIANDSTLQKDFATEEDANEILILAFANIFGLQFLVVPNCHHAPMYPIIPREILVETPFFLFLNINNSSIELLLELDQIKKNKMMI